MSNSFCICDLCKQQFEAKQLFRINVELEWESGATQMVPGWACATCVDEKCEPACRHLGVAVGRDNKCLDCGAVLV